MSIGTSKSVLALSPGGRGAGPPASYIARGLSATLVLQLTSRGLAFLTMLLLSRALGAAGYGQYAYIMACIGILGSLAAFGMPQTVTREIAAFRANHDVSGINGMILFALLLGLGASCILAIVNTLFHILSADASGAAAGLVLAVFLLPLNALTSILGGIQQGLKWIAAAQFPGAIVAPFVLLLVLLVTYWGIGHSPTVRTAVACTVFGAVIALAVAASLTLIALRRERHAVSSGPQLYTRRWLSTGLSIALMSGLAAVQSQADIIMLNWLAGPESTGLFYVATRSAHFLTMLLGAAIVPLGPLVAELYAKQDRRALEETVNRTMRFAFVATLPLAAVMIFAAGPYLALFGSEFTPGSSALVILAIAQLVNVGAGPVQMLLVMTGEPQQAAKWLAASALVNVGLNLALIPPFGLEGAAFATAISTVFWNLALLYEIRTRLGISIGLLS